MKPYQLRGLGSLQVDSHPYAFYTTSIRHRDPSGVFMGVVWSLPTCELLTCLGLRVKGLGFRVYGFHWIVL